ncbi:hypothetical protein JCM19037_3043 [Geomicrobium sp. JCM 19037]|uniref:type VII toxin-antitoxin system MntA family adenylyltransferase antitoxin n=1 Tax=Geomicrobium sp. JCM 19037 TaxID=1460634 RepID=UPI00045F2F45|nr:nucleotidyltransferase domain-containing protein [Geomicrobium sp. JCM 19037]GAK04611.1 hypothetical protein JCM19037_3043 [Geomicrobium sp. JCM 19037]
MDMHLIQTIREHLVERLDARFILVFGSTAKGTDRNESDLDIAYYPKVDSTLSSYDVFMIAQEFAQIIDRDVDIIDLQSASTVFRAEVYTSALSNNK